MTEIKEIQDGIREKGIERDTAVQKILSDIERKRKDMWNSINNKRKELRKYKERTSSK